MKRTVFVSIAALAFARAGHPAAVASIDALPPALYGIALVHFDLPDAAKPPDVVAVGWGDSSSVATGRRRGSSYASSSTSESRST